MLERELIGHKVVSKKYGEGKVLEAKDGKVTIEFPKETKAFSLEIAYRSGTLRFEDETINLALEQNEKALQQKQEEWDASAKENRKVAKEEIEQFKEKALALKKENGLRKKLFGDDYVYEEFERFVKENRKLILFYFDHVTAHKLLGDLDILDLLPSRANRGFGLSDNFFD